MISLATSCRRSRCCRKRRQRPTEHPRDRSNDLGYDDPPPSEKMWMLLTVSVYWFVVST